MRESPLRRVVRRLDGEYGRPLWAPRLAPVDELIFTVLSQNTADVNTERSFAALKEAFADWSAVRDAPPAAIVATIARGGLAETKGPRIKAILAALSSDGGEPDLSILDELSDDEGREYLLRLPGVGPKTAACVLLFSLGRPLMPVDTHVQRVATRLGLLPAALNVDRAHEWLTQLVGPDSAEMFATHVDFVTHGRRTCKARRPLCARCCLRDLCPSAGALAAG